MRSAATRCNRGGALLAIGLSTVGMFGVFLFLTYYLQVIQGYSPVRTGLAFLPMTAGMMTGAVGIASRLLPRVGRMPAMATVTSGVQGRDAGVASASVNTSRQVGGSIGIALLNTIATSATASWLTEHDAGAQGAAAAAAVHGFTTAIWYAVGFLLVSAVVAAVMITARPGPGPGRVAVPVEEPVPAFG